MQIEIEAGDAARISTTALGLLTWMKLLDGDATYAEIRDWSGLSKPSVSLRVKELEDAGLVQRRKKGSCCLVSPIKKEAEK